MLYPEASLTAICSDSLIVTLLATTNSAKALWSALGRWLTWTCQFKLFFIFLTTDIKISFIPSICAFGFRFFFFLLLNNHSFFLLFTPKSFQNFF